MSQTDKCISLEILFLSGVVASLEPQSSRRVLDLKFAPNNVELAFTADSEILELLPIQKSPKTKKLEVRRFVAHEPRVKGLDFGVISTPKGQAVPLTSSMRRFYNFHAGGHHRLHM